jgi:diaminopimelate decarboxylase
MALEANLRLQLEPGRSIIADAGWLLTRVLYTKNNGGVNYAIVDAAMNDLIRPALYGAKHAVTKVKVEEAEIRDWRLETDSHTQSLPQGHSAISNLQSPIPTLYTIAGPVCESGDKLAEDVMLPVLKRGDLLLIHHAGAYGMSMSSNYNTRARAAEVLVDFPLTPTLSPDGRGRLWRVIRPREKLESLWAGEVECLQ